MPVSTDSGEPPAKCCKFCDGKYYEHSYKTYALTHPHSAASFQLVTFVLLKTFGAFQIFIFYGSLLQKKAKRNYNNNYMEKLFVHAPLFAEQILSSSLQGSKGKNCARNWESVVVWKTFTHE